MKKISIFLLSTFLIINAYSQEIEQDNNDEKDKDEIKTIFGKAETLGYFLGISARYGEKYDLETWDVGISGGLIVNHRFEIGIAVYGLQQEAEYEIDLRDEYAIEALYGGIYFKPILFGKFPVHVSFPFFLGGGAYSFETPEYNNSDTDNIQYYSLWLVKPGAELQLNIFKKIRVNLGAYYRFTTDLNNYYRPNDAVNGFSFGITLQIGSF